MGHKERCGFQNGFTCDSAAYLKGRRAIRSVTEVKRTLDKGVLGICLHETKALSRKGKDMSEMDKKGLGSEAARALRAGKQAAVGSTPRIQNLNQLMHNHRPRIDMHRTRVMTDVFKRTEGEPHLRRRYSALAEIYATMDVNILKDERIVMWQGSYPRSAPLTIEVQAGWLNDYEMENMPTRFHDPFQISDEDVAELREIHIPYWYDKTSLTQWKKAMGPDHEKYFSTGGFDMLNYVCNPGAHFIPDYDKAFQIGFKGYAELAQECLDNLDRNDPAEVEKEEFYKGIIKVCEALKTLGERYAAKAAELAETETDPVRAAELRDIARVCNHVPWNPPRDFQEGVQMWWTMNLIMLVESCAPGLSQGQPDRFLYPLYKKGIEDGSLSPEKAMEYLEEFYIKLTQFPWISTSAQSRWANGYYRFTNMHVGGINAKGQDITNDLTYLCLRAMRYVRTSGPSIGVFIGPKTPEALLQEAIKLSAEGMGHPSFFDVDALHRMLERRGGGLNGKSPFTLDQIRNYGMALGCVEPAVAGHQYGHSDSAVINFSAMVSLALHNGVKHESIPGYGAGEQIGPATGEPGDFKTFEDFQQAVYEQMYHAIKEAHVALIRAEKILMDLYPMPYYSIVSRGTIEKGLDAARGGAFCNIGPCYAALGLADAADSLAAVKKLVFEEKEYTLEEIQKAVDANFEGYEEMRAKMMHTPKFGNDDDYVDELLADMLDKFAAKVASYKSGRGNYLDPGIQPAQSNVGFGVMTGALPSGRKAGEPLADTMSACPDMDRLGPTAAVKSYGKVNYPRLSNGSILNMWIGRDELVK